MTIPLSAQNPATGSTHYEKTPRFGTSNLDGGLRYRVERTSSRAGLSPAVVQRLSTAHCYNNYREDHYNSGMIDLGAPIVPGKSAAGVLLGSVVTELLATVRPRTTTKVSIGEKHDLGAVNVWAKDGVIIQVGVYSGYRGLLQSGIRLGSTISEVEDSFGGSVQEDGEDNLVVPNSPGWCFETEEWKSPQTVSNNRNARIVAIFVFIPH